MPNVQAAILFASHSARTTAGETPRFAATRSDAAAASNGLKKWPTNDVTDV